jgi:hypothetical protein
MLEKLRVSEYLMELKPQMIGIHIGLLSMKNLRN